MMRPHSVLAHRSAIAVLLFAALGVTGARAQLGSLLSAGGGPPISRDAPVTFQADQVQYDRDGALVTATGHVEAWQGDRILRADKVTYDRNTGVAAASGHVVIVEPDGQVLFADYAELTQGMRDAVLRDMRAQLAENGKLAANGARRLNAETNELSRAIYSTCNVCQQHPDAPLLWDIRARSATQDLVNKQIEYHDAVIDIYGLPVAYFPYLSQADPSQKRASGLLVPSIGSTKYLGQFVSIPYYYVIDDNSDATITTLLSDKTSPQLDLQYRLRLNEGQVLVNSSVAYADGALQGHIFANGRFVWDDTWRYGFDLNRASTSDYLLDYRVRGYQDILTSQAYIEGFGDGVYTRLDTRAYQGLTSSIQTAKLPFVTPRYAYSFVGEPDALGGRLALDASAFNVYREQGTDTQRASLSTNWERPVNGAVGDLYKIVLHVDSAAYTAQGFNNEPNYGASGSISSAQAMPTAALEMRWPLVRGDADLGTQVIEPIAQLIAAPNGSSYTLGKTLIPDEDSFDVDFTDANLFALNRFSGVDRLEGGVRANVALHANWTFPNGSALDGLIGQGYRAKRDSAFPIGTGLGGTETDVVSHVSFQPSKYVDFTSRQRFDHKTFNLTYADVLTSAGTDAFRVSSGYIYSTVSPYSYYDTAPTTTTLPPPPRNEITLNASAHYDAWKWNAFVRRDLQSAKFIGIGSGISYENECFIFDARYFRRYTSINNDHGSTTLLFTITLKTVGQFGFHAS